MLRFPRHTVAGPDGEAIGFALAAMSIDGRFLKCRSDSMAIQPVEIFVVPHLNLTVLRHAFRRNLQDHIRLTRRKIARERVLDVEITSRWMRSAEIEIEIMGETDFGQKSLCLNGPVCFSDSIINRLIKSLRIGARDHAGLDEASQAVGAIGRDNLSRGSLTLEDIDASGFYTVIRDR